MGSMCPQQNVESPIFIVRNLRADTMHNINIHGDVECIWDLRRIIALTRFSAAEEKKAPYTSNLDGAAPEWQRITRVRLAWDSGSPPQSLATDREC